jgi:excisionase family DNA binding protein
MSRLVSINDAADHLGVDQMTIRRWIAKGKITGYRIGPKLMRVDMDEINDHFVRPIPTVKHGYCPGMTEAAH